MCSTANIELVRSLGAVEVLDRTRQDITAGAARYDLALQIGGTYSPRALRRVRRPTGPLVQSFGDGIREIVEAGHLVPVIDRSFPLDEAALATDLVEQGSPGAR